MRLRQLKKLEEKEMKSEHKELTEYKKVLNSILKSKSKQSKILKEEFLIMKEIIMNKIH